jgi:plastocyanin
MSSVKRALPLSLALSASLMLAFASVVSGGASNRTVQMLDNCDPASFNAVLGEGACARDGGGLTIDRLVGQLIAKGDAPSWRFAPGQLKLAAGGTITAVNRGGEGHTFSEVAEFGGGCIEELNDFLGLEPVPECADPGLFFATIVPPGGSLQTAPLDEGTHLFMCLIHPWQQTTAEVR